ncbi:MAG: RNA polymerase sigma factor RpoH [Ectothiorhodospiraceae bacterium]|nr:RNA polymerase sigma factor RpoH [Chromatiales bacterium]MCP5156928.1 RNA polymerase sigma factor RpoH [Ectothiorhodospiraceae bacterium]
MATKITGLERWSSAGSLEQYLALASTMPVLDADEERALATRMHAERDRHAAERLVLSHLRLVIRIARGYDGYGLALADVVQEGTIGLMRAVRRFDPARGVRLAAFAVHFVRAQIHEFVLRNWRVVRVATTKAQRKLFFNLRGAKRRVGWLSPSETESVASALGVSAGDVTEMESRLFGQDLALDLPDADDGELEPGVYAGQLRDPGPDPEDATAQAELRSAYERAIAEEMARLDPRSRDIVRRRWLDDDRLTLEALAEQYGVSKERVRQIEARALARLRGAIAPLAA